MFMRSISTALAALLAFQPVAAGAEGLLREARAEQQAPAQADKTKEVLTDAAIIALLIAASVAAYKAMGKPCACPSDTARNGSACGGRSAWSRAGGFKPLCFATDITPAMIAAYRATKAVPPLR